MRHGGSHASYRIDQDPRAVLLLAYGVLVIRDVGPWDEHPTVTNDAEHVVQELWMAGKIETGKRLFYFDTAGELDEIWFDVNGHFRRFAPGPGRKGSNSFKEVVEIPVDRTREPE